MVEHSPKKKTKLRTSGVRNVISALSIQLCLKVIVFLISQFDLRLYVFNFPRSSVVFFYFTFSSRAIQIHFYIKDKLNDKHYNICLSSLVFNITLCCHIVQDKTLKLSTIYMVLLTCIDMYIKILTYGLRHFNNPNILPSDKICFACWCYIRQGKVKFSDKHSLPHLPL